MRKLMNGLLMGCLVILLLTGCFKVKMVVKVNSDGSGTMESTMGMAKETLDMMAAMGGAEGAEQPDLTAQMTEQARAGAAQMGEGVKFVELKQSTEGEMTYFTSIYSFENINKVKTSMSGANKMGAGGGNEETFSFKFRKLDDGTSELVVANPFAKKMAEGMDKAAGEEGGLVEECACKEEGACEEEGVCEKGGAEEGAEGDGGMDEAANEMAMQMFKDMAVSFELVCGNEIVSSNATKAVANRVTLMEMDFGKLMENKEKFEAFGKQFGGMQSDQAKMMQTMKTIFGQIDGFTIELEENLKVVFK